MSPIELIDSHCHLQYDYAPRTEADLIRDAEAAGVVAMVTVGTDMHSIAAVQAISERHPGMVHTVGVHPHDAVDFKDGDPALLLEAAKHPKCRAIGEIGLDYHYEHSTPDAQKRALDLQLEVAIQARLPVVIHSRDAEADLLSSLKRYAKRIPADGQIPGVIHCFTGTREFGERCLELGFYISFSGILTFKNAADLRECAAAFPLDRLLVETDSPYLAPVPFRGKKCEPSMVRTTAEKLAEVRGASLEQIAVATTANSRRVFGL